MYVNIDFFFFIVSLNSESLIIFLYLCFDEYKIKVETSAFNSSKFFKWVIALDFCNKCFSTISSE